MIMSCCYTKFIFAFLRTRALPWVTPRDTLDTLLHQIPFISNPGAPKAGNLGKTWSSQNMSNFWFLSRNHLPHCELNQVPHIFASAFNDLPCYHAMISSRLLTPLRQWLMCQSSNGRARPSSPASFEPGNPASSEAPDDPATICPSGNPM